MKDKLLPILSGEILDEDVELSVTELSRVCHVSNDEIYVLVEHGIVEPKGSDVARWRFQGSSLWRVRCAVQLRQDLGVNWAGAALALDLLEELQTLRSRLRRLETHE